MLNSLTKLLLAVIALAATAYLVARGYAEPWTGFGAYTDSKGEAVRAKTLWDWLDLLVVPLFLALAAWWLDGSRKRSDQRVETDRQRQKTLEDYFGCMTEMLLKNQLQGAGAAAGRSIARTRTLAALFGEGPEGERPVSGRADLPSGPGSKEISRLSYCGDTKWWLASESLWLVELTAGEDGVGPGPYTLRGALPPFTRVQSWWVLGCRPPPSGTALLGGR